jgi:mitochondrial chaperone BCS1
LSLALAGKFELELYIMHLPSVDSDKNLEKLFHNLSPQCIVLLEDIDAVGLKNRNRPFGDSTDTDSDDESDFDSSNDEDDAATAAAADPVDAGEKTGTGNDAQTTERKKKKAGAEMEAGTSDRHFSHSGCTLTGLLNVLDGVTSQEGRVVFMTSNFASELDEALIRPGRIDKMVYMGHIGYAAMKEMFIRMYRADYSESSVDTIIEKKSASQSPDGISMLDDTTAYATAEEDISEVELAQLAGEFASNVPEGLFSPAKLQGYLLGHRNLPHRAIAEVAAWVAMEKAKIEEDRAREKARAKKLAELSLARKLRKKMRRG